MAPVEMTVGRKALRLAKQLGWTQADLADALGVQRGTIASYQARPNANPSPDKIRKLVERLREEFEIAIPLVWFYDGEDTEPPIPSTGISNSGKQTNVYYNGGAEAKPLVDSELNPAVLEAVRMVSDPRTIRVSVVVGEGAGIWSAKGAQRQELSLYSFLTVGGRIVVKVQGDSLTILKRNSVLVFEPDDYPHPDRYLLLAGKRDPDLRTIRIVDPNNPRALIDPVGKLQPEDLANWDVLGYAFAEVRGAATGKPDVDIRPNGIPVVR